MVAATCYILYAGLTNTFDLILLISLILLAIEVIALVFNKWACPLTTLAKKYDPGTKDNFDIYLPNWFAKHNKTIFGTIFLIGLALVLINWFRI